MAKKVHRAHMSTPKGQTIVRHKTQVMARVIRATKNPGTPKPTPIARAKPGKAGPARPSRVSKKGRVTSSKRRVVLVSE